MSHVRNTDTTMSSSALAASSCNGDLCPARSASPAASVAAEPAMNHAEPAIADQDLLAECGERLWDEREQGQSHRDEVSEEDRSRILAQVRVVLVAEQAQVDRYGYEEEASLSSARGT